MAKKVRAIPATLNRFDSKPINEVQKRRVAGYARVSTDHEEQATSYEAQVDYYTKFIKARADWEFVGIYTDDGITATSIAKREGFNQMVEDAKAGKIDLIITKSVSRFARNTVDSLTTVRELKTKGVEIYFEKENIWTFDAKGELLITIMSSLAQEESRSISENTTWGKRKSFADGKASVGFSAFLGYDRGPNGEFVINEEQAVIVRYIYKRFLEGETPYSISKELTAKGMRTPTGKSKKWFSSSVLSILTNEKYKGDALLQKSFTKDFLTHQRVENNGEVPQYYVEGHHEGIVTVEQFELVQAELKRRASVERYSAKGEFSSVIKCGDCGGWYGSKVWHSTDKYRSIVYQCNHKYSKKYRCKTPHFCEKQVKEMFIKAANTLFSDKKEILSNAKEMMELVCTTESMEQEVDECIEEMNLLAEKMQASIAENSRTALNQEEYDKRYQDYSQKYEDYKSRYLELSEEIESRRAKRHQILAFIKGLEMQDGLLTEFDKDVWNCLVQEVLVKSKEDIRFIFKGGYEVKL